MKGRASHSSPRLLPAGLAVWAVAVCSGFGALLVYGSDPGAASHAPQHWPDLAEFRIDPARPTLVMLAHPRCPCTRASLAELARLRADVGDGMDGVVLFVRPGDGLTFPVRDDLRRAARDAAGPNVHVDVDGVVAERLGATTSGHVALYHHGELVFQGGLTVARAHEGQSPGRDAIRDYVLHGRAPDSTTPVYGCRLSLRGEERP